MDMSKTKPQKAARIAGYSKNDVTISGLAPGELERVEAAMGGNGWMRVREGRIEFVPSHEPLPAPIEDPLLPWWRPYGDNPGDAMQLELFDETRLRDTWSASIIISSLCGYGYTPENYKQEAERLSRYGFICMRSQRDDAGRYAEFWYLPGLWASKDELKVAMEWEKKVALNDFGLPEIDEEVTYVRVPENKKLYAALEFLRRNCRFGACDVTIQRLAQVIPD